VAILLVITVSVGATLYFTRDSGNGGSTTSSPAVASDVASANDTGPVAIITEDPTCNAYIDMNNSNAKIQRKWQTQRNALGPATQWTPDQRSLVEIVLTAIRNSANHAVDLAKQTPHRVMRELYEQYIAYGRAYADSIPSYVPDDNFLATAHVDFGNTLAGICTTITTKSANRSLAVTPVPGPSGDSNVGNLAKPQKFIGSPNANCDAWVSNENGFLTASSEWQNLDTSVEGSRWTPEQRAIQLAAYPILRAFGDGMGTIGHQSGNPILEDFGLLGQLYLRAYTSAADGYVGSDSWLSYTGMRVSNAVTAACHSAAR
jgi:hypothetical protein